jgi:virulence-associated protein VapD
MSYANCRKAINFDLDTKELKKHYPGKNYRKAYTEIKKFMEKEGFEHRQWSGYNSKDKLSMQDIHMLTIKIDMTFPWLKKCVNRFDVTDIGEQHDLTHIITGKDKVRLKEKSQQKSEIKAKPIYSRANLIKRADEIRKQPHKEHTKNRSQDRDL